MGSKVDVAYEITVNLVDSLNPVGPPKRFTFATCTHCGAGIISRPDDRDAFDARALHLIWHRRNDQSSLLDERPGGKDARQTVRGRK